MNESMFNVCFGDFRADAARYFVPPNKYQRKYRILVSGPTPQEPPSCRLKFESTEPAITNWLRIEGRNFRMFSNNNFGIENLNKQTFCRMFTQQQEQHSKSVLYNYKCNKNEKYLFSFFFRTGALITLCVRVHTN